MNINQVFKEVRTLKGWTFERMGELIGCQKGQVYHYEKKMTPRDLKPYIEKFNSVGYDVNIVLDGGLKLPLMKVLEAMDKLEVTKI